MPHYDSPGLSEVGKGYLEKSAAAMALRAACSGIKIQDSKQNKTKQTHLRHRQIQDLTRWAKAYQYLTGFPSCILCLHTWRLPPYSSLVSNI